jgi:hypothetical protein
MFIGFIFSFTFNTELTTLNLIIYLYIIFGSLLVLILIVAFKEKTNGMSVIDIITNYLKFLMIDLIPIILIMSSIISLIILNFYNNKKINSGDLTNQFYLFNKIYLAILFFQFLNFFIYFKKNISNSNNSNLSIYKILNYILSFINIIITVIMWTEVKLFTTDG